MINRQIKRKIERTKTEDLKKMISYFEELINYIKEIIEKRKEN